MAGRTSVTYDFVFIRTIENLGPICDKIGCTLEPCSGKMLGLAVRSNRTEAKESFISAILYYNESANAHIAVLQQLVIYVFFFKGR